MAKADGSAPEKVPAPWILEHHDFNVSHVGGGGPGGYYAHESWGIQVSHGGSMTAIEVRLLNNGPSPTGDIFIDYSNYIGYNISGKKYSAQFYIMDLKFDVGGSTIGTTLSTCSDFVLNRTPVVYDGAVPTFYCNITLYDLLVYPVAPYPAGSEDSTFDLTLIHHIRGDWNNTQMKIEALYNFSKTKFYSSVNGSEYPAGTPFTAELDYRIYVGEEHNDTMVPIMPTSRTDKTLIFDLNQTSGAPLAVSRLDMKDNFTVHNATGDNASVGYSFMGVSNDMFTPVTHRFPNLTYKDTQWMKSDPKMTVYHDRVTEENNQNPWAAGGLGALNLMQITAVCVIIAVGAIGAILFLKRRRKKAPEETGKKPKKT